MTTPWWGTAAGNAFVGGIRATQSDINSTTSTCYLKADIVRTLIFTLAANANPAAAFNLLQQGQIKVKTCFDACNIAILMNFLDSRMSNLDYTLGMFSNVFSQISSGFSTQS